MDWKEAIRSPRLLEALARARKITVLTGAGISAESGIPTFRQGQSGLWAQFRPEEVASPEGFVQNPKRVWEWHQEQRRLCARAQPNPGHRALAQMEQVWDEFVLITQNIDELHQRAGSQNVLELHGNIHRNRCSQEGIVLEEPLDESESPPRCPRCGAFVRPDVVWFGEPLDPRLLEEAWKAATDCDVFFSIGTSSVVYPAAGLVELAIENSRVFVVEVNVEETPMTSGVDFVLRGPAGKVLPALLHSLLEYWQGRVSLSPQEQTRRERLAQVLQGTKAGRQNEEFSH